MRHSSPALWMLLLVMLSVIALAAGNAWAQEVPAISPAAIFDGIEDGFITRLIVVIKATLEPILIEGMVKPVYTMWEPVIAFILLMAVIIFGLKLATGAVDSPLAQIPILAIKIVFVMEFTRNMDAWVPLLFDVMEELLGLVSNALDGFLVVSCDSFAEGSELAANMASWGVSGASAASARPWLMVDCLFIQFLAFAAGGTAISGLIGFLISSAVSGHFGVVICMAGIGASFGLLFATLRVGYMFVAAMISLAFVLILAPFFVPLLLFQATDDYFNRWVKLVISFMLQPMLMMVFVIFMANIMQLVMFTGEFSVAATLMGEPVQPEQFDLKNILTHVETQFVSTMDVPETQADVDNRDNLQVRDQAEDVFGGVNSFMGMFVEGFDAQEYFAGTNVSNPAMAGYDTTFAMNGVFVSLMMVIIVVMMVNAMLDLFDQMMPMLVEQSWRLGIAYQLPGEQQFKSALASAENAMKQRLDLMPGAMNSSTNVQDVYFGRGGGLYTFTQEFASAGGASFNLGDALWPAAPQPNPTKAPS